jgi:hypothetical protein
MAGGILLVIVLVQVLAWDQSQTSQNKQCCEQYRLLDIRFNYTNLT